MWTLKIFINVAAQQSNFQYYVGKTYEQPYDFGSVLHYKSDAFAIKEEIWTIRPRPAYRDREMGQRKRMSPMDVAKINILYKCPPGKSREYSTTSAIPKVTTTTTAKTRRPIPTVQEIPTTDLEDKKRFTSFKSTTPVANKGRPKLPVISAQQCASMMDTSCAAVQQDILDLVNHIRRKQNAANMMKMQWDSKFMQMAQQQTDKCNMNSPFQSSDTSWSSMQMASGDMLQSWNSTFEYWLKAKLRFGFACGVSRSDEPQVRHSITQRAMYIHLLDNPVSCSAPVLVGNI